MGKANDHSHLNGVISGVVGDVTIGARQSAVTDKTRLVDKVAELLTAGGRSGESITWLNPAAVIVDECRIISFL